MDPLRNFFFPETIAIIGASRQPFKFGHYYLKTLLEFGFPKEKLYPINPSKEIILGLQSYASLNEVPENIGLAYITVPAKQVVEELQNCINKSVKCIIIISSGFKELDENGAELEETIKKLVANNSIRIVGPNCFGIYCPEGKITLLPGEKFPKEKGDVAIFAQSGGITVYFIEELISNNIFLSKAISYGNACDLSFADFLEYLQEDNNTNIVAAYIEGLTESDAKKIPNVMKMIKKPTIIYRAGLSEDGSRAARSHTGFLAGKKELWDGFFKQNNIIRANCFDELIDYTTIFHYIPKLNGNKIGIIAGGGSIGTELSDLCNSYGLKVPELSQSVQEKIQTQLKLAGMIPRNPIDLGNPTYMMTNDFSRVLSFLASDENIDLIIIDQVTNRIAKQDFKALIRICKRFKNENEKPILITLRQTVKRLEDIDIEILGREIKLEYEKIGIPVFDNFTRAVRAISKLFHYTSRKQLK